MKALSITSLILSVVSIFLPMGYMLSGLSGLFALGGLIGSLSFSISALLINLVNIIFLSPTLVILYASGNGEYQNIFYILVAEQVVVLLIVIFGRIIVEKSNSN